MLFPGPSGTSVDAGEGIMLAAAASLIVSADVCSKMEGAVPRKSVVDGLGGLVADMIILLRGFAGYVSECKSQNGEEAVGRVEINQRGSSIGGFA